MQINQNSGGRGRQRRTFKPSSDINITPLVDVMLVLLVIFMVTAPIVMVGVPVDLPKTHAAQMDDQADPLIVSVDATGRTFLQETELPIDELVGKLIAVTGNNPDAKIYVQGDKKLAYGQVMEIMGAIAAGGFSKVSLIAEMSTKAMPTKKVSQKDTESKSLKRN
ncbi:MAG: biopolymer transporter ExbD [Alphaproteobacteria bacterium]|nr:biopolymer transporter ExbD [Alphaproteobacteria bacterium]